MSPIRKLALKHLAYVAAAVVVLLLIGENKGPVRYLAAGLVLFMFYHVIQLIYLSVQLVNDFFPPKVEDDQTPTTLNKWLYNSSGVMFFVGLVAYIFVGRLFENTVASVHLFFTWALAGVGLYIALMTFFHIKYPTVFDEGRRRYSMYLGYFIGCVLLVTSGACFVNAQYAAPETECKAYRIIYKENRTGRNRHYYITVDYNGYEERFQAPVAIYDSLKTGGNIIFCLKQGKLGYNFVSEFKLNR